MPIYQEGVRYIKIAKRDKDGTDQTFTLQSLTQITIPYSTGNITYPIITISEKSTYFLYSVPYTGAEFADRAELFYEFTGSTLLTSENFQTVQDMIGEPGAFIKIPITSSSTDNLGFFHTGSTTNFDSTSPLNTYRFLTYPQNDILVDFTGSIKLAPYATGGGASVDVQIAVLKDGAVEPTLISSTIQNNTHAKKNIALHQTNAVTESIHISASFTSSFFDPKDSVFVTLGAFQTSAGSQVTASFLPGAYFSLSSSVATGLNVTSIPEPSFGQNNFQGDIDCQPLFNNVDTNRRHNLYMDVDYTAGLTEPVNFEILLSGSALRAEVQYSNYTSLSHINPRYLGSKSTSQKLNTFTPGDIGTYGKSPTIQSLKTMVVYADNMSGFAPERMNTGVVIVRYLIDEDGDVHIPNTSQNSLSNARGNFPSLERALISSKVPGSGEATPYREVFRAGYRIEPILMTQVGGVPGATFTGSINLQDITVVSGSATANYQNFGSIAAQNTAPQQRIRLNSGPLNDGLIGTATYAVTGHTYQYYEVSSGLLADNVTLHFQITNLKFLWTRSGGYIIAANAFQSGTNYTGADRTVGIILKNGDTTISVQEFPYNQLQGTSGDQGVLTIPSVSFDIPPNNLQAGDEISIEYKFNDHYQSTSVNSIISQPNNPSGQYTITQTPLPTVPITSSNNAIWGYYDKATNPNVITSSTAVSSSLGLHYGDPNVRQTDLLNSGFNKIALPWSIKYGDEFRFEGTENNTYMVGTVFGPNEGSGSRLSPTGSIEVHFNRDLPISASVSNFNLDHFLIRRYVDDPTSILLEGFQPIGSSGPFIITPEFASPKLNKGIDEYITNLTEKNLLP